MNVKLWTIAPIMIGVLALTGCQTNDLSYQTSQTINMPTVVVNLDSDGDGVSDELDECPGTPYNIVIDERGCPHSLLFGENEFRMEARAYYDENSSEIKSEYYEQLDNAGKKCKIIWTLSCISKGIYPSVKTIVPIKHYQDTVYKGLKII